jgi:hypothetical protein
VNAPPTTRKYQTRTIGGSGGSGSGSYKASFGSRGNQKTHPSLIASDDVESGVNEIALESVPTHSDMGEPERFNQYSDVTTSHAEVSMMDIAPARV